MQTRAAQVILLILSLVLAIFLLIAASKYAAWSKVMTVASGSWLPLVFYIGTIPLLSLLYTTSHLAALQFKGLPVPPYPNARDSIPTSAKSREKPYDPERTVSTTFFILAVGVVHLLAWLIQAILCTSCELAPILAGTQGRVPRWCPQSRFKDTGKPGLADMLGTLATVKDFMQWVMVAMAILLIECARREYMRANRVQREAFRQAGAGIDFGGPSRGGDFKMPGFTNGTVIELNNLNISGPRLFRPEEEFANKQAQGGQRMNEEENKGAPDTGPRLPPGPVGPGVPGNRDNYYGNGMGLKRSNTLNYMYESRV
ncbi:uncharacterized protein Z518_02759 [Rhinocladiella mackenziei CBS 650.93]|uniref:Uncharacterized protein n=1 Tax=Rhinocladiella mackenziei CBS 650.93 TaxID=1442369 RepID=A0A0D2HCD8_9EURO|nr:uncharacterized protein Z518_02759 [Rhinocladiella mackenziei CBS 650.93]KIX08103.1 hypothetical protein Z518_02759 [Rhinocladiella mackenziei CBS 650.93]